MIKDINKYFKNESNLYSNQETLGYREMFIRIVVKEWVIQCKEEILFDECNQVLVNFHAKLCYDCWCNRCSVVHVPENKKKF